MNNIDKIMAEKVMGWKYVSGGMGNFYRRDKSAWGDPIFVQEWHPSTDISQALGDGKSLDTVVGKMRKKPPEGLGFKQFSLHYNPFNRDGERWVAQFSKLSETKWHEGFSDDPAMAIVKAALACEAAKDG